MIFSSYLARSFSLQKIIYPSKYTASLPAYAILKVHVGAKRSLASPTRCKTNADRLVANKQRIRTKFTASPTSNPKKPNRVSSYLPILNSLNLTGTGQLNHSHNSKPTNDHQNKSHECSKEAEDLSNLHCEAGNFLPISVCVENMWW